MFGYMLLMLCLVHRYNLYTITTSMLLIHEQSSPHTLIYLVGKLYHIAVEFTFMIHKVLVEILVYMHGSRYVVIFVMICVRVVPPRTRMIFVDDLCEGSSPKITYGTY